MNQRSTQNGQEKRISEVATRRERNLEGPAAKNNIDTTLDEREALKVIGGESLAGSGFEDEEPEEDFQ